MKLTIDLTNLSIMQRFLVKEMLIKFFNKEERDRNADLEGYDEGEARNDMVKWRDAAKQEANSIREQVKGHFTLEVGKRVKVTGRPKWFGKGHPIGHIGTITDQEDGYSFKVDGVIYEGRHLTTNF